MVKSENAEFVEPWPTLYQIPVSQKWNGTKLHLLYTDYRYLTWGPTEIHQFH